MSVHDKKLRDLINLTIVRHWASHDGRLKLKDVINEIRISYPYRKWSEIDVHTACNAYLGSNVKGEIQHPMSKHFVEVNDVYVPKAFRKRVEEMPRGFYNRATNEWIDSLDATAEDWEEGEDARLELAKFVGEAAEPFKLNARLLKTEGVRTFRELFKRKK